MICRRFASLGPILAPLAFASVVGAQTLPPSAGGVGQDQLDSVLDEIRRELATQGLSSVEDIEAGAPELGSVELWPDLNLDAQQPAIRELVHPADRSVRILTQPLRHTTLMLAPRERIVDIVVGDAIFFEVTGADNVAFLKPMQQDRRTSVSLTTNLDRTYAFDVFSTMNFRPDEVVRVRWPEVEQSSDPFGFPGGGVVPGFAERDFGLDFVPAVRLDDMRSRIRRVRDQHARVVADGAAQLAAVERLAETRYDEFLRTFPRRIEARYRLSPEIQSAPLFIHQMFTDGQFTYLRSSAQESPALYTLSGSAGSEPSLVNVTLSPEGFYVIDHVVSAGFAQLHGSRGEWYLWDIPPMTILPEVVRAGLPADGLPPRWIRAGNARSWSAKHPKMLRWLLGAGIAGTITVLTVF